MEDDLSFELFRQRLQTSGHRICKWVSLRGDECHAPTRWLRGPQDASSYISEHPEVQNLKDLPESTYNLSFCNLHSATAKELLRRSRSSGAAHEGVIQLFNMTNGKLIDLTLEETQDTQQYSTFSDEESRTVGLRYPDGTETLNDDREHIKVESSQEQRRGQQRADMFYATRERDDLSKVSPFQAEDILLALMQSDIRTTYDPPGRVYAFRDHDIGLVKFGSTKQFITTRLGSIQSACNPGKPLSIVAGENDRPIETYEVLEQLLHSYLRPHLWTFNCVHGKNEQTTLCHREYFQISDDDAKKVFQLWRRFMDTTPSPYRCPKTPKTWRLRRQWRERLPELEEPSESETLSDHDKKLARWEKLFALQTSLPQRLADIHQDDIDNYDLTFRTNEATDGIDLWDGPSIGPPKTFVPGSEWEKISSMLDDLDLYKSLREVRITVENPSETRSGKAKIVEPNAHEAQPGHLQVTIGRCISVPPHSLEALRNVMLIATRESDRADRNITFGTTAEEQDLGEMQSRQTAEKSGSSVTLQKSLPKAKHTPQATRRPSALPTRPRQGRSPSPYRADAVSTVEEEAENNSFEHDHNTPDASSPVLTAKADVRGNRDIDWPARWQELNTTLDRERKGLPARTTIRDDLVKFRWPLAFALCLSASSSYIPGLIAFIAWVMFLPCLVAELRSWYPQLDQMQE